MIQSKLTFNGDAAQTVVLNAGWDGIRRAVVFFWNTLQKELNIPNPGKRVKRKRKTSAGPKGSSYTIYPSPSAPGEPPRKRTGWGAKHVIYELDKEKLTGRVGVGLGAKYMIFLEFGTRRMRNQPNRGARPWLFATLKNIIPQLKALAESGRTE